MSQSRTKHPRIRPAAIFQALVIYITIALPLLWFVHFERGIVQAAFVLLVLVLDLILVLLLQKNRLCRIVCTAAVVLWICAAVAVCTFLLGRSLLGSYRCAPMDADFFAEKNVLFIVPHQDDDVALAGGVAEQYVHAGSNVSIVFVTNGDSDDLQERRAREALASTAIMGVAPENIFYLGFGDGWQGMDFGDAHIGHIYNSPDASVVWTSSIGNQETQNTSCIPCYQSVPYTRENYANSIKALILDLRPDVIYATDYDAHPDHRATSLFFEEAMCQILRENETYRPMVFKGYCYRTVWYSFYDFADSLNLISTVEPPQRDTEVDMPQYPWAERVRLPLLSTGLHRLLTKTSVYAQLREYPSQGATSQTGAIANGDRVYWQRNTNSLLYHADFLVGQTPAPKLNDFKLMDSANIQSGTADSGIVPIDAPVVITLPSPMDIRVLALYDDPRAENQILAGCILLSDGTKVAFDALNNNGSATYIPLPDSTTASLTLQITQWEGTPGLTEVEAYATDVTAPAEKPAYFLFVDEQDNFVYDYYVNDVSQSFSLYTYPHNALVDYDAFQITQSGGNACSYTFENGVLTVHCPEGQQCDITVTYEDITCSMAFSNPGTLSRWLMETLQAVDYSLLHSKKPYSVPGQISYYRTFFEKMKMMLPR